MEYVESRKYDVENDSCDSVVIFYVTSVDFPLVGEEEYMNSPDEVENHP